MVGAVEACVGGYPVGVTGYGADACERGHLRGALDCNCLVRLPVLPSKRLPVLGGGCGDGGDDRSCLNPLLEANEKH